MSLHAGQLNQCYQSQQMLTVVAVYAFLGACLGGIFGTGNRVSSAIRFAILFGATGALLAANS
ncbi:MAG: hypothetical protein SFV17_10280 [Candidatus Obscuribacter sp.]|nr:hypothetical protein [Candidatus Obscuribacter sp.]